MEIIYKNIKLYFVNDYPSKEQSGFGGCLITNATEESADKIMHIMSAMRNKTVDKPEWYKEDITIGNNLYCGCWPFETKRLNDETYVVKLYYDKKVDE